MWKSATWNRGWRALERRPLTRASADLSPTRGEMGPGGLLSTPARWRHAITSLCRLSLSERHVPRGAKGDTTWRAAIAERKNCGVRGEFAWRRLPGRIVSSTDRIVTGAGFGKSESALTSPAGKPKRSSRCSKPGTDNHAREDATTGPHHRSQREFGIGRGDSG
jgi:hypothetical protein